MTSIDSKDSKDSKEVNKPDLYQCVVTYKHFDTNVCPNDVYIFRSSLAPSMEKCMTSIWNKFFEHFFYGNEEPVSKKLLKIISTYFDEEVYDKAKKAEIVEFLWDYIGDQRLTSSKFRNFVDDYMSMEEAIAEIDFIRYTYYPYDDSYKDYCTYRWDD